MKKLINKLTQKVTSAFAGIEKTASTPKITKTETPKVTPKRKSGKTTFQKIFRSEERLKLEAYMSASTQAEQDVIVASMKDSM